MTGYLLFVRFKTIAHAFFGFKGNECELSIAPRMSKDLQWVDWKEVKNSILQFICGRCCDQEFFFDFSTKEAAPVTSQKISKQG